METSGRAVSIDLQTGDNAFCLVGLDSSCSCFVHRGVRCFLKRPGFLKTCFVQWGGEVKTKFKVRAFVVECLVDFMSNLEQKFRDKRLTGSDVQNDFKCHGSPFENSLKFFYQSGPLNFF